MESDSVKLAGESEMWAIMVVLQLMLPNDSLSSMVSLLSLNNSSKIPLLDEKEPRNPCSSPHKIMKLSIQNLLFALSAHSIVLKKNLF